MPCPAYLVIKRCLTNLSPPRRSPRMQALGKRLPFAFLADVSQQFQGRYSAVAPGAVAYETACRAGCALVIPRRPDP